MADKIPFNIYFCLINCFGSLAVGCVTSDLICYLLHFYFGCNSHVDLSKSGSKAFYHFNRSKNGKIYCFGIAALIPLVFSFQKASHTPLQATNAQFTYATRA